MHIFGGFARNSANNNSYNYNNYSCNYNTISINIKSATTTTLKTK